MPKKLQYSSKLISIEDDKNISKIFYDGKYIASLNVIYDKDRSCSKQVLFDLNKDFDLNGFFNESLKQSILVALTFPIKELIFENFPIIRTDFEYIFQIFQTEYEDNIDIIDMELDSNNFVKRVIIQIKLPKNTHYIQQAYLRNFSSNIDIWKSTNQKKKARIFVFNKQKNSIETINNTPTEQKYGQRIEIIAREDYFYSLAMEQLLRRVYEKNTPPIFKKLINIPRINILSYEEKLKIVDYILLTWQRTKEQRKILEESWEKMGRIFAEDYKNKKLPPEIKIEVNPNFIRRTHEEMMVKLLDHRTDSYKRLSNRLLYFEWKIIKTKTPYTYLTSDNPVIFYNSYYEKEKSRGNDFMNEQIERFKNVANFKNWDGYIEFKGELGKAPMNKGIEIYLPVSPNICLCLFDKTITKKILTPPKINREIIIQSDNYIFSSHNKLDLIKKIISKNPSCVDKDGNRQEIRASFRKILKSKLKQNNPR